MGIRLSILPKAVAGLVDQVAALATRTTAVEQLLAARTQGTGTITAAIGIGGLGPVTVTFDRAMPDTNYAVISVQLEGVSGLAGVLIPVLPVTSPTKTGCVVQVRNTGLIAIGVGATVRVTVEKLA